MSIENYPLQENRVMRIICRIMKSDLATRINQRLEALSLSSRKASLAAGCSPDLLNKIVLGKSRSLRGDNLTRIARVLKVSEAWLNTGEEGEPTDTTSVAGIRFGGIVEAGAYRKANLLDQDSDYRIIPLAPDPRYPASAQFAFEVKGDSMTRAHIAEGMWVQAVELHSWERQHGEPQDGKLVIVAHVKNGDGERELTVKRLRIFRDRMELQPESDNKIHGAFVFPNPPKEELAEAQIIAIVLSATWLFT